MFISTQAFVDKNESIKTTATATDTISIEIDGKITLYFSRENAEKLYKQIEQAMWTEDEWSDSLRDKVDELEGEVRRLEDKKECYMFSDC